MKKSTLTLAVIVALGAAWTGSAWYTGKKAEAEYQTYLAQMNEQLSPYDISIDKATFERGIFSSEVAYTVLVDDSAIPFTGKLYHGPLPLNHLSAFDFSPVMFSKVMDIVKNENTQKWFDYAQNNLPLRTDTSVSYSGNTKVKFLLNPTRIEQDDLAIAWDKGVVTYEFDSQRHHLDWDLGQITLKFQNLDWDLESELQSVDLGFNQFKAQLQWEDTPFEYIKLGKLTGTAADYWLTHVTNNYKNQSVYKDWQFDYQLSEKDGLLNLKLDDQSYNVDFEAKTDILLHFQQLDIAALNTIIKSAVLTDENGNNPIAAEAEQATQKLIQNQPHFMIKSDLNGKNNAQAKFNVDMQIGDVSQAEQQPLSIFKKLDIHLESDKTLLEKMATVFIMQLANISQEEAHKLYAENSEKVIKQLINESIVKEQGNQLAVNFKVENNQLQMNDRTFSESELQMMLFVLMMMFGNMGN